jgi:hypothetical protein
MLGEEEGGGRGDGQDGEQPHQSGEPGLHPGLELALGLEGEVQRAVHRQHGDGGGADEEGERVQQVEEAAERDLALGVQGDADDDVAEGDAEQQGQPQ